MSHRGVVRCAPLPQLLKAEEPMTDTAGTGRAIVLFSGGQDSTTCLAWSLNRFESVDTVGFDYGQRHRIELACRTEILDSLRRTFPTWRDRIGADYVLDLAI